MGSRKKKGVPGKHCLALRPEWRLKGRPKTHDRSRASGKPMALRGGEAQPSRGHASPRASARLRALPPNPRFPSSVNFAKALPRRWSKNCLLMKCGLWNNYPLMHRKKNNAPLSRVNLMEKPQAVHWFKVRMVFLNLFQKKKNTATTRRAIQQQA